jgi:PEP-CTERM motif
MMARTWTLALLAWGASGVPAQAVEEAAVERLSLQSRVSLRLGNSMTTQRITGPFDLSREVGGQGKVTASSSSKAGGGIDAMAISYAGRALADFDSVQTFRFTDTRQALLASFAHIVLADVYLPGGQGSGSIAYALRLYAPDGRQLMDELWTDSTRGGANAGWYRDIGPVSFLVEPGVYRVEMEGVASTDVPPATAYSHARIATFLSFTVTPVPEPSAWALLFIGLGVVGVAAHARRVRPACLPAWR